MHHRNEICLKEVKLAAVPPISNQGAIRTPGCVASPWLTNITRLFQEIHSAQRKIAGEVGKLPDMVRNESR